MEPATAHPCRPAADELASGGEEITARRGGLPRAPGALATLTTRARDTPPVQAKGTSHRRGQSDALVMPIRGVTVASRGGAPSSNDHHHGPVEGPVDAEHRESGDPGRSWPRIDPVDDHRTDEHGLTVALRPGDQVDAVVHARR